MRNIFLFLLLFLFLSVDLLAQKALQAIDSLYHFPQEKVVLSFSKSEYLAGETIYFKAYVLAGYELSPNSTNLYTELYDKNKKIIAQHLVPLLNSSGEGAFSLPASLAEDVYYIRAYTRYMLNYPEAFQCIKPVNIYNPASMFKLTPKPVQWKAKAFAEGGVLLNGLPGAVAVRLFTDGSLPTSWQAVLLEKQTGKKLEDAAIMNSEIGMVRFTPVAGKDYELQVKDNSGTTQVIDIPKAVDTGNSLQVQVRGNKLGYTIQTKNIASNGTGYKLIGTMHDQSVFVVTIKNARSAITGEIDITKLVSGVVRVTLFDAKENPMNERLCFVRQQVETAAPAVQTDTLALDAKGLNNWKMEVDSLAWPTYSVQVNDATYPFNNEFLSDVYLNTDLENPIDKAYTYLQDVNAEKIAALDVLLVTEKWKRFQWTELLRGRFPAIRYLPEKYLSYKATVYKGKKPQPLREINLVFKGKDSSIQFAQFKTNQSGSIDLDNIIIVDTMQVYYQANSRKFLEKDVELSFVSQNQFSPLTMKLPPSRFQLTLRKSSDSLPYAVKWAATQRANELLMNEKEKMMEEVVIRTRARTATEELDSKLSSPLFSSVNATVFDFINENQTSANGYSNILEWLRGRVPSFSLDVSNGELIPYLRGSQAQVFLDEMLVDAGTLQGYSASDIAMIKVIKSGFVGSPGGNSAIVIYTRRGGMNTQSSTPSMPTNTLVGYTKLPPFFSPDYSQMATTGTDQRQILFRNTMLFRTLEGSLAPIRFYNNDNAKKFRLLVTGFTNDGHIVFMDKLIAPN